jgi:hypothetical protein
MCEQNRRVKFKLRNTQYIYNTKWNIIVTNKNYNSQIIKQNVNGDIVTGTSKMNDQCRKICSLLFYAMFQDTQSHIRLSARYHMAKTTLRFRYQTKQKKMN